LMFADKVEYVVVPGKGRPHALRVIRDLIAFTPRARGPISPRGCATAMKLLRHRAIVVVLSDFRAEGWRQPLAQLAARQRVVAVTVDDPRERVFPMRAGWSWRIRDAGANLCPTGRPREAMHRVAPSACCSARPPAAAMHRDNVPTRRRAARLAARARRCRDDRRAAFFRPRCRRTALACTPGGPWIAIRGADYRPWVSASSSSSQPAFGKDTLARINPR